MGRHHKTVVSENGFDRRQAGYYSTPSFVAQYFFERLISLKPEASTVYDPCVGRGELLHPFRSSDATLIGSDIIDMDADSFFEFRHFDFLKEAAAKIKFPLLESKIVESDIIVANPPYNCHEHEYLRENKEFFINAFGKSSFLNYYSLFITALIKLARVGTVMGIITLDSFLTARGHEPLRELIKRECKIHEVLLCPTDLFRSQGADVRTCILILEKSLTQSDQIYTLNRPITTKTFSDKLQNRDFKAIDSKKIFLNSEKDRGEFLIGVSEFFRSFFSFKRIGDLFECKTGISTGNDKAYLSSKKASGYSIPFYKNPGNRRFYTAPDAYVIDSYVQVEKSVKNFIVRNKSFIGCPGITCSSMGVSFGAAYMPEGGAFGVNANIFAEEEDLWWLLAYLNSSLCNYIVRGILLRSNMITAGYVSRIPVPDLDHETRERLAEISWEANSARVSPAESCIYVRSIDNIIFEALGISKEDKMEVTSFCEDIIRRT